MKHYNIEIGKHLKLKGLVYRVSAKNKKEAIKKVETLGFNCGHKLSMGVSGEFKANVIDVISEESHKEFLRGLK